MHPNPNPNPSIPASPSSDPSSDFDLVTCLRAFRAEVKNMGEDYPGDWLRPDAGILGCLFIADPPKDAVAYGRACAAVDVASTLSAYDVYEDEPEELRRILLNAALYLEKTAPGRLRPSRPRQKRHSGSPG